MFKRHRFEGVRKELETIVGPENVFTDEAELLMYSYDAGMARAKPEAVLLFTSTAQVAPAVKVLYAAGIPFLPRIAGTNLSGGTIPLRGGVILNLTLLNKIRRIDTVNRMALVADDGGDGCDLFDDRASRNGVFFRVAREGDL